MKPNPTKRSTILGFLMALCFISHLNRISLTIAADERIMPQYGITPKQMGLVYSAFLIIYTLAMIPGGFFIDRVGTRRALMVMGFGSALFAALTGAVGLALTTAATVSAGLLGVRSLMGLVTTPLHPGCARAVAEWFPPTQRTFANGLVTGAALLGIACTYPAFGWLIDKIEWPTAFVVCASATALVTVGWAVFARGAKQMTDDEDRSSGSAAEKARDEWRVLTNPSLILVTLSYAAVGYFQYLFFYWIHYYFDTILHLGKEQSRLYAGLPTLAMAFCMPLGGWLCDRLQHRYGLHRSARLIAIAGMVLSAIMLWCALWAPSEFWMVASFTLSLGALGLSEGSFWLTAVELGGRKGGTAAAIMNTGGNGIGLLAPLLTPYISQWLGWRWGIAIGGVVALLGALCWIGVRRDSLPRSVASSAARERTIGGN